MKSIDTKNKNNNKNSSAIENLIAHRKLWNHPNFIYNDKKLMKVITNEIDSKTLETEFEMRKEDSEIYEQSGKLCSLISLLEECGMLNTTVSGKVESTI